MPSPFRSVATRPSGSPKKEAAASNPTTRIERRFRREGAVAIALIDLHHAVAARLGIQHRDIELSIAIEVTGCDAVDAGAWGADVGKDRGAEGAGSVAELHREHARGSKADGIGLAVAIEITRQRAGRALQSVADLRLN